MTVPQARLTERTRERCTEATVPNEYSLDPASGEEEPTEISRRSRASSATATHLA